MKQLAFLLLTALACAAADSRDEKAVRAAIDKFNESARQGDEAQLKSLLGDGLMYAHSNARVETKAEAVAALVKSKPNFVLEPDVTIQVYGNSAVAHGRMTANNVTDGKPTKTSLHFVQTWVKDGNAWKMVARHTTRLP